MKAKLLSTCSHGLSSKRSPSVLASCVTGRAGSGGETFEQASAF